VSANNGVGGTDGGATRLRRSNEEGAE